jgi:hypothetical protein
VKLPAHKFVLSLRSDVFETMFYGSLAEGGATVLIKDVKSDVMKTILRLIYHNTIACTDVESAVINVDDLQRMKIENIVHNFFSFFISFFSFQFSLLR